MQLTHKDAKCTIVKHTQTYMRHDINLTSNCHDMLMSINSILKGIIMWFSTEKIYICIYQKSKKKNLIDFKYRWMGFKTFYFYNKRWFYFN